MMTIAQFAILSAVIFVLGYLLSRYSDQLADSLNIEKSLIGLFLLAIVTSVPELITSINSAVLIDSPNMAVGNVLGSNVINMVIGGVLPLVIIRWSISHLNFYMGFVSVILSLVVMAGLMGLLNVSLMQFNLTSLLVAGLYFISLFMLKFRGDDAGSTQQAPHESPDADKTERAGGQSSPRRLITYILLLSLAIIGVGTLFVFVCDRMVVEFNLSRSFMGIFFMAFATSLPELVVTFSSIKLGSYAMAMGNVLGSNCFNLLIIFIVDGITLEPLSFTSLNVTTFLVTILMTIALLALNFNIAIINNGKRRRSVPYALLILLAYSVYLFFLPKH